MNRKWVMIGATSVLGLGMVAGGAVMTAQAMTIEDTRGSHVGERITITAPSTGPNAGPSDAVAPTATTAVSAPDPQPAPAPLPDSVDSPDSAPSPVVVSVASAVSVPSAD